jgi:hypothetical protein
MTYPTFNTGDVLTAAEMNAVGLWLIRSETLGNNLGSFTPASAVFSSTYDNYLVTYTGGACSAQGDIGMILGSTTSGYVHSVIYTGWSNAPTVAAAGAVSGAGAASWGRAGIAEPDSCFLRLDIFSPNLPKRTIAWGAFVGSDSTRVGGSFSGFLANTTAYTNFTLTPSSGLLSGGVVRVFGYNKG